MKVSKISKELKAKAVREKSNRRHLFPRSYLVCSSMQSHIKKSNKMFLDDI